MQLLKEVKRSLARLTRRVLEQAPSIDDAEVLRALFTMPRHLSGNDVLFSLSNTPWVVRGDLATGAINFSLWGIHRVKIAASTAETNTLGDPLAPGLLVVLTAFTVGSGGTRTITYATGYNSAGNTTVALSAARQNVFLYSVPDATSASGYRWTLLEFDSGQGATMIPNTKFTATTLASATYAAGDITGAMMVYNQNTAVTPGTLTTRTATQMFGDFPGAYVGLAYTVRVINVSANVLTVLPGSGWTPGGTMTLAANTWRDFLVTFTSGTAGTFQSIGTGTNS